MKRFIARGTREFTLANVALFAAGFTTFALIRCVQPVMPVLGRDLGVDAATTSLSLSATTQCLTAMLVASSLSKVWGRKPVMVQSLFSSSALLIASAFSPNWASLLAPPGDRRITARARAPAPAPAAPARAGALPSARPATPPPWR